MHLFSAENVVVSVCLRQSRLKKESAPCREKEENGMVLGFLVFNGGEYNRSNDNGAFQHHLRVRGHIHQIQQVVDDTQDEHANNHSADVSLTAGKTGSADNDGGNAVICQSSPLVGAPTPSPGCQENSGDTSTDRTENIGSNLPFGHIDAGKLDSLFISADA